MASSQYDNFCAKLAAHGMTVRCSADAFREDRRVLYDCPLGHASSMTAAAFINKTAPANVRRLFSLCAECHAAETLRRQVVSRVEELGFQLVGYEKDGGDVRVRYVCSCGNESSTDFRNLKKKTRQAQCPKCQNEKNKVGYKTMQEEFARRGCELRTPAADYKNNKQPLEYRCRCGRTARIIYHDLIRGRLCGGCGQARREDTNRERYGEDNPSKNADVKRRIVETMMAHHGVAYAQQHPEIRAKTDATCLDRYGFKRAFLRPEVFDKIRAIHRKKYGVDFPLQCPDIQAKIEVAFEAKWGAARPFLSDAFLQTIKEKYGHEWFCCTDRYKEIMLERYGAEHYLQSDHYKQAMLERYGAESPMQCPELFRRAQQASFQRRAYVSPDGERFMILGYEDAALNDLFRHEGVEILYAGEDPRIPIYTYLDEDGKTHKYYPDIYIPRENRVIEVKSIYVYNRDPQKTLHKALSVSEDALFELRLYDHHREIVEILECRKGILYSRTHGRLELGLPYARITDAGGDKIVNP